MAPRLLLRWVDDRGVLHREWFECTHGYIGRLSRVDLHLAGSAIDARYGVYLRCLEPCYAYSLGVMDASVSRRHLLFRIEGRRLVVVDSGDGGRCRGSSNGTLVNGAAAPRCREVDAGATGAVALGGLVLDYHVGSGEPPALLVSAERGMADRVAPPSWRVYETRWLPRIGPEGERRMSLVLALAPEPRGSPRVYETRAVMFAAVALKLGDSLVAERALYAAVYSALVASGIHPSLDVVKDRADALLRVAAR